MSSTFAMRHGRPGARAICKKSARPAVVAFVHRDGACPDAAEEAYLLAEAEFVLEALLDGVDPAARALAVIHRDAGQHRTGARQRRLDGRVEVAVGVDVLIGDAEALSQRGVVEVRSEEHTSE